MEILNDDLAEYFAWASEAVIEGRINAEDAESLCEMLRATAHTSLPPRVAASRMKCVCSILCFTSGDDNPLILAGLNLIDPIVEDKDLH
jgi:hypothetical protein